MLNLSLWLTAVRYYLFCKQVHRALHRRVIDQPTLVEVGDKLLHREFAPELINPPYAVRRVAEDSDVAIYPLVSDVLEPLLQLLMRLVAPDRIVSQWLDQLARHGKKMHQALFAFAPRLFPAVRDMHRKRERNVLLPGLEARAMYAEVFAELVRRVDQRRGKDRKAKLPRYRKRLRAVGGDSNRRMRFLHWLRSNRNLPHPEMLPFV